VFTLLYLELHFRNNIRQQKEEKELSIDEIAYLVGYTELSSFYRVLKKWTGKMVSQYQKEK